MWTCLTWLWLAAPAQATDAKPVTVPFELLRSKHMAVRIKVNGKGPYRVIFDTGAPVTLLSSKVARESGLTKKTGKPAFRLFPTADQVTVRELQVGGVKAEDVPVVIMDHPTVELAARALGPLEGIVGFPFFARYRMTLDYQARELTFVPNGFEPPDALRALTASLMAAPRGKAATKVVAPGGQFGLVVDREADDEDAGVSVKEVLPGGAAAEAGVKAGDRLLTLDGRWTDSVADCYEAASHVRPGEAVPLTVRRDGKELRLQVKPRPGL